MPGEPQDVRANPVNSTTINVVWKPPQEKDRNGIIRGYHIHAQEIREEVSVVFLGLYIIYFIFIFSKNFNKSLIRIANVRVTVS